MTGNDENDRRSSRPQMLSRLLRGDELPKDGACLVLAKLGALDKDEEDENIDADLTDPQAGVSDSLELRSSAREVNRNYLDAGQS